MDESAISDYMTQTFPDAETSNDYGYLFWYYRSERMVPFASLSSSDNEYDNVSNLNRAGVYRLNIGVSRPTFQALFGTDKVAVENYDFTTLDEIMPHPQYANQSFICVLAPSAATFEKLRPLLTEAYELAARRFARKNKTAS